MLKFFEKWCNDLSRNELFIISQCFSVCPFQNRVALFKLFMGARDDTYIIILSKENQILKVREIVKDLSAHETMTNWYSAVLDCTLFICIW